MEQERTAIIELFRNVKNPGEILKLLNFLKRAESLSTVRLKGLRILVEYLTSLDLVAQSLLLRQG